MKKKTKMRYEKTKEYKSYMEKPKVIFDCSDVIVDDYMNFFLKL